ncbi:MAG: hypothetical protein ABSG86_01985 [Thermoguttaceae bacterium]|jgi:hypothetical protein
MEKIRPILAALKKHLFWVLSGILVLVCLTTWLMATSQLSTKFEARSRQLNSRFNEVRSTITDNHPNEEGIRKVRDLHGKLGEDVFAAWGYLYEQQRRQNPLPAVVKQMPGFEEEFEKRWGPLEKFDPNDPKNEMEPKYRDGYANRIKEHFPTLTAMIDRRYVPEDTGGGAKPPGPRGTPEKAPAVQPVGTVWWEDADWKKTEERFTRGTTTPSTIEVLLAQEDLWVYEALLRVIRNSNNSSADPANYVKPANHKMAPVKRIMAMQIGQDAVASWQASDQSVIRLPAAGAEGGAKGGPAAGGVPPGPSGPRSGTQRGGPMGTAAGSGRPGALAGRYVDDQGKPLTDPTQQPYAEFRMMPINLRVVIEQNQIPKLLAECANSNMPIEVRKVRLLEAEFPPFEPAAEAGTTPGTGPAAAPGKHMLQGPGPGAFHPQQPGTGAGPRGKTETLSGEEEDEAINPMEPPVLVEVQGIIYIYNPPVRENLGKGTAGGAVATPTGPGVPPGPATVPPGPAAPVPKPAVPAKPAPTPPVGPGLGVSPPPPLGPATPKPPAGGPAVPPRGPVPPKGGPG